MKILLGNNRLAKPGGSETYTYAMAAELVQQGHEVTCVASGPGGLVSAKLADLGITTHFRPIKGEFDAAFLSHYTSINLCKDVHAFKVQTCHGVFPKLEQPVPGMEAYVAISEEVQEHLRLQGYSSELIRNGVDCDRFSPESHRTRDTLCVVLSLVHSDDANKEIREVCRINNWDLLIQNKYRAPVWEVESLINKADLVVGLGRGVYESMACGRNVVIFDHRPYMGMGGIGDGFVDTSNVENFLKYNCSGRYSKLRFDDVLLQQEMEKYDPVVGEDLREFALEHLNIEKQIMKYLKLVQ